MIGDIPDEIICIIFEFCDIKTIYNLMISCRKFNVMIENDCMWKCLLKRAFDTNDIKLALLSLEKDISNKNIYKKCLKIYNLLGHDRCRPDIMNINVSSIDVQNINQDKIVVDVYKDKYAKINRNNLNWLINDIDYDLLIKYIKFEATGYINKILLLDFPKTCDYILMLNGQDTTIANYNNNTRTYEFTLDNIIPANYDFNKLYSSNIIFKPKTILHNKHHIRLSGKFKQDNMWIDGYYDTKIYPYNQLNVPINNPTHSLDIRSNSDHGNIILLINGFKYGTFKSTTKMMRLKFYDENLQTVGIQNKYLPDEINKTTINMSNIKSLQLIRLNCEIIELYQNYYNIYNRADDMLVF